MPNTLTEHNSSTASRQLTQRVRTLSGWIGQPLTREQRLKKFHSCARRVIDERSAERVVDLVERLDALGSVTEIMDIVRGKAQ